MFKNPQVILHQHCKHTVSSCCFSADYKRRVRTTYLSCSCDISVGRTGLSSWYWKSDPSSLPWTQPLTRDEGHGKKQGLREERVLSAFLAFLGLCWQMLRFYLWKGLGLDYRWTGGRGFTVNYLLCACHWLSRWPTWVGEQAVNCIQWFCQEFEPNWKKKHILL